MKLALTIIACIVFYCSAIVNAQSNYTAKHYGIKDGLSQSQINLILPEPDDYLLIATDGGMAGFTGNGFTALDFNKNTNGYVSRVNGLYKQGTDTILAYSAHRNKLMTIVKHRIISIENYDIKKHGLLLSNSFNRLPCPDFIKKLAGDTLQKFLRSISFPDANIKAYNKDTFAIAKTDSLTFYTDKGKYSSFKINKVYRETFFKIGQHLLFIDAEYNLQFYTAEGFLKTRRIPFPGKYTSISYCTDALSQSIFLFADDDLLKLDITGSGEPVIEKLFTLSEKLPEKSGLLWIKDTNTIVLATFLNGLYVFHHNVFNISQSTLPLNTNAFYTQLLMNDGATILANGATYRDNIIVAESQPVALPNIFSTIRDYKGNYWISGIGDQLVRYDSALSHKKIILKNYINTYVNTMFEDRQQRLWVANPDAFGYIVDDVFTAVPLTDIKGNVIHETVLKIAQDKYGNYFIGTINGLYMLGNSIKGPLQPVPELKGNEIRYLKYDEDNNLWIGTYGGGLFVLHNNKITSFAGDNRQMNYVHSFIQDNKGRCWIPSNSGLWVADKKALISYAENRKNKPFFYVYTQDDGLRTSEFNGGGCPPFIILKDSTLSLPSMDGLVSFKMNETEPEFSHANIIINKILLDTVIATVNDSILNISSDTRNIRCFFENSFWGELTNLQLEYQLIDAGDKPDPVAWVNISTAKEISFLAPGNGNHKLVFRKRVGLKENDFIYQSILLRIKPKWFQTKGFMMLTALLIAAILVGLYELRFYRQDKKKKELEEKVLAATEMLKNANNELSLQNNTKAKLISAFTHDIHLPMQYISTALKYQLYKAGDDSPIKKSLNDISGSTEQLVLMTSNILEWIKLQQQNENIKFQPEYFSLSGVIDEKAALLSSVMLRKEIRFINQVDKEREIYTDRNILGIIIYNILSNAVKFTGKGDISITIRKESGRILLYISDTGRGMAASQLEKINSYFSIVPQKGTIGEKGNGIGLSLVRELALVIHCEINIDSTPGRGTVVKVSIPSQG